MYYTLEEQENRNTEQFKKNHVLRAQVEIPPSYFVAFTNIVKRMQPTQT
jgi:hypothetical protein